jgi:hypothetical protein
MCPHATTAGTVLCVLILLLYYVSSCHCYCRHTLSRLARTRSLLVVYCIYTTYPTPLFMCPHTTTSAAGTSLTPRANALVITSCFTIYILLYMCPHTTTSAAGTSLTPHANALVITPCVEVLSSSFFFSLFFFFPSFFFFPPQLTRVRARYYSLCGGPLLLFFVSLSPPPPPPNSASFSF